MAIADVSGKGTSSRLLAQSRHEQVHCTCPLSGVKRTSRLIASSLDKLAAHWPATASPLYRNGAADEPSVRGGGTESCRHGRADADCGLRAERSSGPPFGDPDLNPLRGFVFNHLQDRASQDTVGEPELIQNRVVVRVGDWNQIARKMSLRPVSMVITAASDHRRQLARAVRNGKRLVDVRPAHWRQGFNLLLGQLDLVVDMRGVAKGSEIKNSRDGHSRRHF